MGRLYLLIAAAAILAIFSLGNNPTLKQKHAEQLIQEKPKILIVPGHEPKSGGTTFLTRKERDMTVILAEELRKRLIDGGRYDVTVVRDSNGFTPIFAEYFYANSKAILEWQTEMKKDTIKKVNNGEIKEVSGVEHNRATAEEALHLYGINRFANEQDIDMVIHLHFNDDARRNRKIAGKYSGFVIYVPEQQYGNSKESRKFAEKLLPIFEEKYKQSTLPVEKGGIVESQELIALGRYRTLEVPSVLIETGYIYEPIFEKTKFESETAKDIADRIHEGLSGYLFPLEQI